MDTFGKRFKKQRKLKGLTQEELANMFHLKKSSISRYEHDKQMPEIGLLKQFANFFDVSLEYLVPDKKTDDTDLFNLKGDIRFIKKVKDSEMVKVPVLGVIKAGIPMFAEENIIDYEYVHQEELIMGEETFFLEVKGDSMINARIYEGDRVRIRKQNYLDNNGDIMAVRVNGDEATLKRVYLQDNGIMLLSENPKYAPMFHTDKEIENNFVEIIGKAVEVKFKP